MKLSSQDPPRPPRLLGRPPVGLGPGRLRPLPPLPRVPGGGRHLPGGLLGGGPPGRRPPLVRLLRGGRGRPGAAPLRPGAAAQGQEVRPGGGRRAAAAGGAVGGGVRVSAIKAWMWIIFVEII